MVLAKTFGYETGLIASHDIIIGTQILDLEPDGKENRVHENPDKYTVNLWSETLKKRVNIHSLTGRYLNHACQPNAVFRDCKLIAIENIKKDQQITFDYRTTEPRITSPFNCKCGSVICAKVIR